MEPETGLILRAPGAGWVRSSSPTPGACFTLVNREMETSVSVYWAGADETWPGPAAPANAAVKPVAFGGWPGEGWNAVSPDAPDRERVVRRMRTEAGRVSAVLDAPREFASAALLDFAALLRGTRVPGAGAPRAVGR
jgi:hypothetical protein